MSDLYEHDCVSADAGTLSMVHTAWERFLYNVLGQIMQLTDRTHPSFAHNVFCTRTCLLNLVPLTPSKEIRP